MRSQCLRRPRDERRGFVLIAVLSILAISVTLFGVWARRIVNERGRLQMQEARQQAISLAEAGLERGKARLEMDSHFKGEEWTVTKEELGGTHGGKVNLKVITAGGRKRVEATAEYPSDTLRSVHITKATDLTDST